MTRSHLSERFAHLAVLCEPIDKDPPVDFGAAIAAGLRRDPLAANATCDLLGAEAHSLWRPPTFTCSALEATAVYNSGE
jgi:hypothetical protein